MAVTRYCIKTEDTDGILRNNDTFVLVPDSPSQEKVEIGINDCSGFYRAVKWRDMEDDYVDPEVDFFQKGVPCLVSWDAENVRWIIGAAAQTINDRIWLGVPADAIVTTGNARLTCVAPDKELQNIDLTGGRPASSVIVHNGRSSGALTRLRFKSTNSGVEVLHKGVPFTEDIELPAGSMIELVCIRDDIYSMVSYTENLGGPGYVNSDLVYTEKSLYAGMNTPYAVNTTNDVVGIILPANPSKDNFTSVQDVAGNCGNRFCYVIRNPENPGYTIDGFDENFIINLAWGQTLFVYDGEGDWKINPDAIGSEGEIGPEGPQGPQGASGIGAAGPQGPQGAPGVSDIPGPQGDTGPQGSQGVAGPQGTDGVSNVPGPQGDEGAQGPQGTQGNAGPQGATGSQGVTGAKGAQGDVGPQGAQGADSTVEGPQGPQGAAGAQGPQGFQGVEGSGSQAHDLDFHTDVTIAAPPSSGQVLTWDTPLQQWIPKTPRTVVGVSEFDYRISLPPNAVPANGRVSRDNADPALVTTLYFNKTDSDGNDLSLFLENMDTGDWINLHDDADVNHAEQYDVVGLAVLNAGIYEVPVIFFDNPGGPLINNQVIRVFWRINEEQVEGPQGPQGTQGETGAQGDTGPQGPQGDDGADGAQGETGAQGAAGADGVDGAQGATGDQGPQGFQSDVPGPQGAQGDTGPQGATGAASTVPGPQGDSGADGADGAQGVQGAAGAAGGAGPQGDPGPQGAAGTNGAQGPQGVAGAPSTVAGPQGDDGATGAQGVKGAQGDTGASGGTGPQGAAGAQGATGAGGPQGPAGGTGPQGAAGRSVVVTESATEPASPQPGDIWIIP